MGCYGLPPPSYRSRDTAPLILLGKSANGRGLHYYSLRAESVAFSVKTL